MPQDRQGAVTVARATLRAPQVGSTGWWRAVGTLDRVTDWVGLIGVAVAVEHLVAVPVLAGGRYLKALHRRLDAIQASEEGLVWGVGAILTLLADQAPQDGLGGETSAQAADLLADFRRRFPRSHGQLPV